MRVHSGWLIESFPVFSSANNLHYFKGFESQMEAWRSFADLDVVFAQSGHKNKAASKRCKQLKCIKKKWDWFHWRFCEVVLLSCRICPRSLEGRLVLWLPVSQWQQPSPVTPNSTPPPQPVCYLWDAPSFLAWRLFPWAWATGALKLFWATVM